MATTMYMCGPYPLPVSGKLALPTEVLTTEHAL